MKRQPFSVDVNEKTIGTEMKISVTVFHQSMHLETDLLEPLGHECPICGSIDRKPLCLLQGTPEVFLLECAVCHAASASRMPTDRALEAYYAKYYESPLFSDSANRTTFDGTSRFGRHLASVYRQHQRDLQISILDIGGGDGAISHAVAVELLKKGASKVNISVVDYNEDVILPQDSRITISRKATLEEISSRHNFIIASAIIEHIPKPCHILDSCFNLLEKGGIFYARTPYMVPIMKLCGHFGIKLDLTYPAHVHDLGQKFWESYFNGKLSRGTFRILRSRPSIVETSFREHFLKTLAAYSLKSPWYLIGRSYKLVGGWEIFAQKS